MDVTDDTFEAEVLDRSETTPVVVDLWAPWCGPCRTLGPIIEDVVAETKGKVQLVKVNVDENPRVSATFQVQSIPGCFCVVGPKSRQFIHRGNPAKRRGRVRKRTHRRSGGFKKLGIIKGALPPGVVSTQGSVVSDPNSVSRSVLLRNRAREVLDDVGSLRLRAGAVLILVLVALGVFGLNEIGKHRAVAGSSDTSFSSDSSSVRSYASSTTVYSSTTAVPSQLVIYVVGAVKTPGLFTVASNARVSDAVAAAGGLTADADVGRNNLAAKVTDGERVYLLKTGEAMPADSSASSSSSSTGWKSPGTYQHQSGIRVRAREFARRGARYCGCNRSVSDPTWSVRVRKRFVEDKGNRSIEAGPDSARRNRLMTAVWSGRNRLGENSDRRAVVVALVVAAASWAAWPVASLIVVLALAVAAILRVRIALAVALALFASFYSAHEWRRLDAPVPVQVSGVATIVQDPKTVGHATNAEIKLDGRHYELWAYGSSAYKLLPLLAGDRIYVSGRTRALSGVAAPTYRRRHIAASVNVVQIEFVDHGTFVARTANGVRTLIANGARSMPEAERGLLPVLFTVTIATRASRFTTTFSLRDCHICWLCRAKMSRLFCCCLFLWCAGSRCGDALSVVSVSCFFSA